MTIKKYQRTLLFAFAIYVLTAYPAQAMDHHSSHGANNHAMSMDHSTMNHEDEAPMLEGADIKDFIPVLNKHQHNKASQGSPMTCEHHTVCPSDHVCETKNGQCHTVNPTENMKTCSISKECGGGLPLQATPVSHDREGIITSYLFKDIKLSSYFLPPQVEVSLAGFTGELERPPQFSSL